MAVEAVAEAVAVEAVVVAPAVGLRVAVVVADSVVAVVVDLVAVTVREDLVPEDQAVALAVGWGVAVLRVAVGLAAARDRVVG